MCHGQCDPVREPLQGFETVGLERTSQDMFCRDERARAIKRSGRWDETILGATICSPCREQNVIVCEARPIQFKAWKCHSPRLYTHRHLSAT